MRTSTLFSIIALCYSSTAHVIAERESDFLVDSTNVTTRALKTVNLGTAKSYGVVSGITGISNVGLTVVTGNLGTTATSVSGFGPGLVAGVKNIGNNAATQAFTDAKLAYGAAKGLVSDADISTLNDLTGKTFYPGIYFAAKTITLTGPLYLDGRGSPTAIFVFQAGSSLLINLASSIILTNGAKASNVFWQTGSSATIAVGVAFQGNVLAYAGIAVKTGASVKGSLMAMTESITLESNSIQAQII
ncbi:hypothetical protein CIB48_g11182 [Xylaria polymorpha]|nr:hypothetical protein CIB48_g11182 [Xylaria polymorpha]